MNIEQLTFVIVNDLIIYCVIGLNVQVLLYHACCWHCVTEAADSCALNAVTFLTQSEVAAVNSIGQFKIWDIRRKSAEPVRVFVP